MKEVKVYTIRAFLDGRPVNPTVGLQRFYDEGWRVSSSVLVAQEGHPSYISYVLEREVKSNQLAT